jgi:uncharacterized protein YodC (DUF2158 family)
MADEIKEGDRVRLKSGGPVMTVESISAQGAFCIWFEGPQRHQGMFKLLTLEPAPQQPSVGTVRMQRG